jgi:hypothetical protein
MHIHVITDITLFF